MNASGRAAIFGLAIFSSATLIFLVQPLVGKRILPWFGGAPGVWAICLAFYQTTLFLGYAYAHSLVRLATPRRQLWIHSAVLVLAAVTLPVLPGPDARPAPGAAPEGVILGVLIANVALPFLALAATGPLIQVWFALRYPDRSPYFLYAVSNLGSLLGLLGYSFYLESTLSLSATGRLWSVAFMICAGFIVLSGFLAPRSMKSDTTSSAPTADATASSTNAALARPEPPILEMSLWSLLAASAVILLTGLTNEVTVDVASVPFLWVLMLAAYLMSFILAFSSERAYPRPLFLAAAGVLLLVVYPSLLPNTISSGLHEWTSPIQVQFALYAGLLFCLTMVLHGELYRIRPDASDLTRFYLCVSAGGALGGLFSGLLAPHVFSDLYEVPAGLALGYLTLTMVWFGTSSGRGIRFPRGPRIAFAVLGGIVALGPHTAEQILQDDRFDIHRERGFFGVLRVTEIANAAGDEFRGLVNGTTVHGQQNVSPGKSRRPTTYYGVHTAIGFALRQRSAGPPLDVGVVGLGIGTLAAYGREGDRFRFYEIDPGVTRIARDSGFFSYLSDSGADTEVVSGDARLSLESERAANEEKYDLLVLDAFTSDSIPIHLLTREAFELYRDRLKPNGLLACHVSNRHFDLEPILARLGKEAGLTAATFRNRTMGRYLSHKSKWVILSRELEPLRRLGAFSAAALKDRGIGADAISLTTLQDARIEDVPLWTDDYSDLLGALR